MQDESILVVDDSPTILKLVEMTLAKAGFRVSTADCGEVGILAASERPPDLLLLDYLLPDLNGDDVCRAISGNVALATMPVVVMSPSLFRRTRCSRWYTTLWKSAGARRRPPRARLRTTWM